MCLGSFAVIGGLEGIGNWYKGMGGGGQRGSMCPRLKLATTTAGFCGRLPLATPLHRRYRQAVTAHHPSTADTAPGFCGHPAPTPLLLPLASASGRHSPPCHRHHQDCHAQTVPSQSQEAPVTHIGGS